MVQNAQGFQGYQGLRLLDLGINMEGKKEILGIWNSVSESASFWTTVFNELKNRGVKDILIACHDNTGMLSQLHISP